MTEKGQNRLQKCKTKVLQRSHQNCDASDDTVKVCLKHLVDIKSSLQISVCFKYIVHHTENTDFQYGLFFQCLCISIIYLFFKSTV